MKLTIGILALCILCGCSGGGVKDSSLAGAWVCEGEFGSGLFLGEDGGGYVFIEGDRSPLTWGYDGQDFDVSFRVDGADTPQSYSTSFDNVGKKLPLGRKMPGVGCDVLEPGEVQIVPAN